MSRQPTMTHSDYHRLCDLLDRIPPRNREYFLDFHHKLERAHRVESAEIPPDIVTMDSIVRLWELKHSEPWTVTLVFPWQADIDQDRISVMTGVGTALIGSRVGELIEWPVPGGTVRARVTEILYQPEAAGLLDDHAVAVESHV
jgi:regulator of nucleoside diphosphate kinase